MVDDIVKSIDKFGFTVPIVVRKANMMVAAGHTRLKAALKMGLKEVPVRILDITQRQLEALTIADNKLGEKATWDETLLKEQLQGLLKDDFDLNMLGFDGTELASLLAESPSVLGGDSIPAEAANGKGMTDPGAPQGDPSHVRMVQLFLDETTHPVFLERCKVLGKKWGLDNVTKVVMKALEEIAKEPNKKGEKTDVHGAASNAG